MSLVLALVLTLCICGSSVARETSRVHVEPLVVEGREVREELYINTPYQNAGEWGKIDICADGSFASAVEIKYSFPNHVDETAINGVKLYCSTDEPDYENTGAVMSSVGKHGDWYGIRSCRYSFITGFRANVLQYQGLFTDDVAVENIQIECGYGEQVVDGLPFEVPPHRSALPRDLNEKAISYTVSEEQANTYVPLDEVDMYQFKPGGWSSFAQCQEGTAVCGIRTCYENFSIGDEVSISDVILYCCDKQYK